MFTQRRVFSALLLLALLAPTLSHTQSTASASPEDWSIGDDWIAETVATGVHPDAGKPLALDSAGSAFIAYYDGAEGALKMAHQDETGWLVETVAALGPPPTHHVGIDLALDDQDTPYLGYVDPQSAALKLAHRSATGWQIETVDPQVKAGSNVSMALDSARAPHLAYWEEGPGEAVGYATRSAAGWQLEMVMADLVRLDSFPALVVDQARTPHVAFVAKVGGDESSVLKAARNPATGAWDVEQITLTRRSLRKDAIAIAATSGGAIAVAWSGREESMFPTDGAYFATQGSSTGWQVETLEVGEHRIVQAVAFDGQDHPFIALANRFDWSGDLQMKILYQDAAGWHMEIPDLHDQRPNSYSLALDGEGRPHVGFQDEVDGDLRLVSRKTAPPIANAPPEPLPWQASCIDCPRGFHSLADHSLRFDGAGRPHIAYGGDHLYYATDDGSDWNSQVVDPAPGVGQYASLALDAHGLPGIAYYDTINGDLKLARLVDGQWQIAVVESEGNVGSYASLAIDGSGRPHIGYIDYAGLTLRYAVHEAGTWLIQSVVELEDARNLSLSLALTADGRPHIAFTHAGELWHAVRESDGWQVENIVGDFGANGASMTIDDGDLPHIATGGSGGLAYARQDGTGWQVETFDPPEYTQISLVSLGLDNAGLPHISHRIVREDSDGNRWTELSYLFRDAAGWRNEVITPASVAGNALALEGSGDAAVAYLAGCELVLARYGPAGGWHYETVDRAARASGSAMAVDMAGVAHVSYASNGAWYAVQEGTGWRREQLPGGSARTMAVGMDGAPHLASVSYYQDPTWPGPFVFSTLGYTTREAAGGQWLVHTINYGRDPSLALNGNGIHMSYRTAGEYGGDLWYAVGCDGGLCQEVVDERDEYHFLGVGSSLALNASGQPMISYLGYYFFAYPGEGELYLATHDGAEWQIEMVEEHVDPDVANTVLLLDPTGRPLVLFVRNHDLWLAARDGEGWQFELVDGIGEIRGSVELLMDGQGRLHAGYFRNGRLRYAMRTDQGWQSHDVGPAAGAACCQHGMALGRDDRPMFVYTDRFTDDFMLVGLGPRTTSLWLPLFVKR